MTGTSLRYYIFPKNTPWGVIRKADGTLQYKHVIRFENDDLRTQFVNRYLNENRNYKNDLNSAPLRAFDSMTDLRIHFRILDPANFNRNINADFMVAKIGGVEKFFALKVLKTEGQTIFFEGELDIFFTYKIAFRENSQNFVARAHLNRLVPDGSRFKLPTIADFPEMFYASEGFEIPLNQSKIDDIDWDKSPDGLYWMIFWSNSSEISLNTVVFNGEAPYSIFFFPFTIKRKDSGDLKKVKIEPLVGNSFFSPESIYTILKKDPSILKIIILPQSPVDLNFPNWEYSEDDNEIKVTQKNNSPDFSWDIRDFEIGDVSIKCFQINHLTPSTENFFTNFKKTKTIFFNTELNRDPKLFSPQFFKLFLKNYFSEKYEYPLSLLEEINFSPNQNLIRLEINSITNLSLESPNTIFWIEEINRFNLLNGRVLEHSYTSNLPQSLDLSADYLLKNKNQIQTQIQQSQFNRNVGIAKSVLGGLLAAGAIAAAPFTGGGSLGAAAAVGIGLSGASAGLSAITGGISAAKTHEFTKQRIDSQFSDLEAQPQPIKIAGNDFYEIVSIPQNYFFTKIGISQPTPEKIIQISEFLNIFGYQLNKMLNINSLLSNRKYWNFIQASDAFNSIVTDPELSSPQKQIISNAFAEGLTFWHFRNFDDWLGVLSYDRENWETNYNFSRTRKKNDKKILQKNKNSK